MRKDVNYTVTALNRGLHILEVMADIGCEIGVAELSKKVDLHLSTTHRLLVNLKKRGFVEQDAATGKYKLGLKCLQIGAAVLSHLSVRQEALPFLRELNQRTGETVHLTVLYDNVAVYIEKIESPTPLTIYSRIGKIVPLHCTGVGKVLLAFMPEAKRREILRTLPLTRYTKTTITDLDKLTRALESIREKGYAIDNEEHEIGVGCVAAPIWDYTGQVVASVSVTAPSIRLLKTKMPKFIEMVLEASQQISARLGYDLPSVKAKGQAGSDGVKGSQVGVGNE